jgi:hypothetical protein
MSKWADRMPVAVEVCAAKSVLCVLAGEDKQDIEFLYGLQMQLL